VNVYPIELPGHRSSNDPEFLPRVLPSKGIARSHTTCSMCLDPDVQRWVNRLGWTLWSSSRVYLEQRTSLDQPGWSVWCPAADIHPVLLHYQKLVSYRDAKDRTYISIHIGCSI
jgi:hypothetical protein